MRERTLHLLTGEPVAVVRLNQPAVSSISSCRPGIPAACINHLGYRIGFQHEVQLGKLYLLSKIGVSEFKRLLFDFIRPFHPFSERLSRYGTNNGD